MWMRSALVGLLSALLVTVSTANVLAVSSPYLAISGESVEGVDSVRWVGVLDEESYIGVWGGKPFVIKVDSSYPMQAVRVYIAMSDGRVRAVNGGDLMYSCDYYIRYYGLVIAVYPNERVEALSFWITGAWDLEDADIIPKVWPKVEKPRIDDEKVQPYVDEWWETTVIPKDKEFRRLWGYGG